MILRTFFSSNFTTHKKEVMKESVRRRKSIKRLVVHLTVNKSDI